MADTYICKGKIRGACWALTATGKMPAKEFYEKLDEKKRIALLAKFNLICNQFTIINKEQFRKLENDLFEFKQGQIRIICFFNGDVILTNGFFKQGKKTPRTEIECAEQIKKEYLERLDEYNE